MSIYDLDDWPKIPLNNFKLKNCLLVAINLVKNSDKSKCMYSSYRIAFDSAGPWSFGNYFARNVVIFGVNNSSSSRACNRKNNFLVLGERSTDDINDSIGTAVKKFSINFSKTNPKFCLSLHFSHKNSYLFVNGKEIYL